jgi:hypothetical protein
MSESGEEFENRSHNDSNLITSEGSKNDSPKLGAVGAELQLLKPMLAAAIRDENPVITDVHLDLLVEEKLAQAKAKIPKRWSNEPYFQSERQLVTQLYKKCGHALEHLQAKDKDDPSAEIEARQVQAHLDEWLSNRRPILDEVFDKVRAFWYKLTDDPLVEIYSHFVDGFDDYAAQLKFEISSRPLLSQILEPKLDNQATQVLTVKHEQKNLIHFDAAKLCAKFAGDLNDPEVLIKFANWRSSWDNLVQEMKSLPGHNNVLMFQKLKDCLEDPALSLVSHYSAVSSNSYEAAYKDLIEKFEDPIGLASCYITKATDKEQDQYEMADSILQSYNALHGMRDVFEKEKVDMYDFALMHAFFNSMTAEMQSDWNAYKVKKKEEYKLKVETAKAEGESIPEWHAGMVENYKAFSAWLTLFRANKPKTNSKDVLNAVPISTASNFAVSGSSKAKQDSGQDVKSRCFICKEGNVDNHPVTRCPRGQNMTLKMWRKACREDNRCYKCAKPFSPGHLETCRVVCIICKGKSYDNDHHVLMCPMNSYRSFPVESQKKKQLGNKGGQSTSGVKRPNPNYGDDERLAKFAKMVGEEL